MKSITLLGCLVAVTSTFGQQVESNSSAPLPNDYEKPGRIEAKMFVPSSLMKGPSHRVGAEAENNGLDNTYFLYSGDDGWGIMTIGALRTRIAELYAIEKLKEMKKGKEFTQAIAKSGEQKVESAASIVVHPFGTITGIPRGASRFFGRVGEGLKGGDTEGEGNIVQNASGVQKARVALAVKLGVSPYSHNQELQKELTTNARAIALGGLVVSAATAAVGGPAGTALSALNINQTLQGALVNSTPDDLRIMNRKKLFALGVTRENADRILMHPWYSPWVSTIMIDALAKVGVDPTEFLAAACAAISEEDAVYFQRIAQVLAAYAERKSQIQSILVENGTSGARDSKGNLVVPVSCDYAIWSENNAARCRHFAERLNNSEVKGLLIWVDGRASERLVKETKALRIETTTNVLSNAPAETRTASN